MQVTKTGQIKNGLKSSAAARIPLEFQQGYIFHAPLRDTIDARGWQYFDCTIDVWCHDALDSLPEFQNLTLPETQLVAVEAARRSHGRLSELGHDMVRFRANAPQPPSRAAEHVGPVTESFVNFANSVL